MTREIKFRVWDKRIERMVGPRQFLGYDNVLTPVDIMELYVTPVNHGYWGRHETAEEQRKALQKYHEDYSLENFVMMQYIGLKDKEGREIYEGDIIQLADGSRGEVKFSVYGNFYHTAKTELTGLLYWNEVIGNIWENKELLL